MMTCNKARFMALSLPAMMLASCVAPYVPEPEMARPTLPEKTQLWRLADQANLSDTLDCLGAANIALVSAHRGGPYPGYAENAIGTFAHMLEQGMAMLEVDVQQAKDGTLFLFHDYELNRKTTGIGKPEEHSWAQLSQLLLLDNQGNVTGQRIPSLDAALNWAKDTAILQLDIKRGVDFGAVVEAVKRHNMSSEIVYIAYNQDDALDLHRRDPEAMISYNIRTVADLDNLAAQGFDLTKLIAFVAQNPPPADVVAALEVRNIEVNVPAFLGENPLDNEQNAQVAANGYRQMLSNGTDIVATNNPVMVAHIIAEQVNVNSAKQCGILPPQ